MKHIITDVVVPNHSNLHVTKEYLSPRSLASLECGSFESLIRAATAIVRSQEPYAIATLLLNLKDGRLSSEWLKQSQSNCNIGNVTAYVDVIDGRNFKLSECAITHVELGEPTRITIKGTITKETASAGMNV
jgi:hypothetical protein